MSRAQFLYDMEGDLKSWLHGGKIAKDSDK